MFNSYNPYGQYRPDVFGQIQNIAQTIPTQVQCFFVNNQKDMEKIQANLNVVYIGINKEKNEVYLKQMNNNGLIDFNVYTLANGGQEKNDFTKIMEKIQELENKVITKGVTNATNQQPTYQNGIANASIGQTQQPPANATIQSNDVGQNV